MFLWVKIFILEIELSAVKIYISENGFQSRIRKSVEEFRYVRCAGGASILEMNATRVTVAVLSTELVESPRRGNTKR